jgi:hypothetical protein
MRFRKTKDFLKRIGLDTAPAVGAGVRPSKSVRGYSTTVVWLKFESVKWLADAEEEGDSNPYGFLNTCTDSYLLAVSSKG